MTEANVVQASSLSATPSEISSTPPVDSPSGSGPGAMSVEPSTAPAAEGEAPPGPATAAGGPAPGLAASVEAPRSPGADTQTGAVTPSCGNGNGSSDAPASCGCKGSSKSLVYAIGQIGFDFGTEARRDTFRQLMPPVIVQQGDGEQPQQQVAPNPYAIDQLTDYLDNRPSECTKVIWTLNLDLTPIYAVVAEPDAYADEVYKVLRTSLRCSALPQDSQDYISRISVPGVLTNRTVRLFSGQVLPVVVAQPRGLYAWSETTLVNTAVQQYLQAQPQQEQPPDADIAAGGVAGPITEAMVAQAVRIFLDKIYFEMRNLGYTSSDRALNYAGTECVHVHRGHRSGAGIRQQDPRN